MCRTRDRSGSMIAQERKTQGKKSDQENAEQDMPRFFEGFRRGKIRIECQPVGRYLFRKCGWYCGCNEQDDGR